MTLAEARSCIAAAREECAALDAERLLGAALDRIESPSIREWVNIKPNRPVWLKLAQAALDARYDADRLAAYIICTALGA